MMHICNYYERDAFAMHIAYGIAELVVFSPPRNFEGRSGWLLLWFALGMP